MKHLPSFILEKDEVPLLGSPPSFPLEVFTGKLKELFSISHLELKNLKNFEWREGDLLAGLGQNPHLLSITLHPSLQPVCWVFSKQDGDWLITELLLQPGAGDALDKSFKDGFYLFLAAEVLNIMMQSNFDKTLAPQILEKTVLPEGACLCLDIAIELKEKSIVGRLILSKDFLRGWKERYVERSMSLSKPLLEHLNVTIHVEAGKTSLTPAEWENVKVGDFIFLDFCALKSEEEGRVMLTLNEMPLFRGKIKDGNIKILEHPLYHEGETP